MAPPPEPPEQDHAAIDAEERAARHVTILVGIVTTAICALLLIVLAVRLGAG
jgi:hypothetical protein